ncbi:Fc.00g102510.m01.CDS01 [Cosmosporella sp. VM-42]
MELHPTKTERRLSFVTISSRSSSVVSLNRKAEPLLPCAAVPEKPKPKIHMRSLLGHYHYRRVLIWSLAILFMIALSWIQSKGRRSYDVGFDVGFDVGPYHIGKTKPTGAMATGTVQMESGATVVVVTGDFDGDGKLEVSQQEDLVTEDEKKKAAEQLKSMPWLRFHHLDAYFNGLKSLTSKANLFSEYPYTANKASFPPPVKNEGVPKPTRYSPYDKSEKGIKTCYLDANRTVPAPDIYAYNSVPQHMPNPALGSHELLGIRDDVCFDRFGRYGPYGLGYTKYHGGSGAGIDTESSGSEEVWAETGKINYVGMDWGDAQERCYEANKHRFRQVDPETDELKETEDKKGRIAIVVRTYTGFRWTEHAILNFRAMINELSLRSGGEYDVHFLMHVRNPDEPIFADDQTVERIIRENIPAEFRSLVTLWSETQMQLFYPGQFEDPIANPASASVHGIYRSAHLPLQVFALQHPEYEHFWNWEMDMRYLGSYYEFFNRIGKWSAQQPRPLIWERNARYYIPSYHGSWKNFTETVQNDTIHSGRRTIFGPMQFEGSEPLRFEEQGKPVMPESCSGTADRSKCGVGEDGDIITLNPIFDADESGWVFAKDVTGYKETLPPRRCALITASRLSRRLLMAMHEEVWRHHHTMFSEMFPASVALHHGFKGVYAPHPVFLDRAWYPASEIDTAFNGGRDHSTSGHGSPFDFWNEHYHKGTSWYFNSEFAGLLWRRWLGYAQNDRRGKFGAPGQGKERGGKWEEMDEKNTGRMCLRGMLVHPIKYEHPTEKP